MNINKIAGTRIPGLLLVISGVFLFGSVTAGAVVTSVFEASIITAVFSTVMVVIAIVALISFAVIVVIFDREHLAIMEAHDIVFDGKLCTSCEDRRAKAQR